MHQTNLATWQHSHAFGLDQRKSGERRTLAVAILTAATMVVEVLAGLAFGSMALLADGLHMASHATALGIAVLVYVYARRRAGDSRFAFGTGKVNALGGYTSALLLTGFALYMAVESAARFLAPVPIAFDQAIFVAVLGLLVNGVSVAILGVRHDRDGHDHHGDLYGHRHHDHHQHDHHGHDHNLRGAYLHVLADALTSVLAIVALVAGKYAGAVWLDPAMGLLGALLVGRWAWGLTRDSSRTLLDRQAPAALCSAIRRSIESCQDTRVADLHVWSIGPGLYAAELAVVSHNPAPPSTYKRLLPEGALAHVTVEVHRCPG
jgi:cation diffusion facilitator family transporter